MRWIYYSLVPIGLLLSGLVHFSRQREVVPTVPITSADPPLDPALLLSEQQRQALKSRTVLGSYGSMALGLALVSDLAPEIQVADNKISLVLDSVDVSGEWTVVYLINDSDRALAGAVYEGVSAKREVFNGWYWEDCEPPRYLCPTSWTVMDLNPGHALALRSSGFLQGDEVGQVRYCLSLPSGEILATKPCKGRYSSACLKDSRLRRTNGSYVSFDIRSGLLNNNWSDCRVITNLSEVQAALEIERQFDTSFSARGIILKWLERVRTTRGQGTVVNPEILSGISSVVASDWDHHLDYRNRLSRCLAALSYRSGDGQFTAFGSPESCRALVLRYLRHCRLLLPSNPEQKEHYDKALESGNPWGAKPEELEMIRREAEISKNSGTEEEKGAATGLLSLECFRK